MEVVKSLLADDPAMLYASFARIELSLPRARPTFNWDLHDKLLWQFARKHGDKRGCHLKGIPIGRRGVFHETHLQRHTYRHLRRVRLQHQSRDHLRRPFRRRLFTIRSLLDRAASQWVHHGMLGQFPSVSPPHISASITDSTTKLSGV